MLTITTVEELQRRGSTPDEATVGRVEEIVCEVRDRGESALREFATELDGLAPDRPLILDRGDLESAWSRLDDATQGVLQRTADRIRAFAERQRECLTNLACESDGLMLGHECVPVGRAGCYAPGGRYPLPSSVLMTAVPARVAGVPEVVVVSPRPHLVTLGAAFVAGADSFAPIGGAQAIAALAYGVGPVPRCDMIVGPGNRFVTAAKHFVSRDVGIDMLAGPSELAVLADDRADAHLVAADLIAQAEHDPDALPVLITTAPGLIGPVRSEVDRMLEEISTEAVARVALRNGGIIVCPDRESAIGACEALAPEHVALHVDEPTSWRAAIANAGAIFEGEDSSEVLGDYGVGPNHVLPTGGHARHSAGLSVFTFLRIRTFLGGTAGPAVLSDVEHLAKLEGLPGHARAASLRRR